MKKLFGLILFFIIGTSLYGQYDEDPGEVRTLFGHNKYQSGGYGGFGAGYTVMDGKDAIVVSARGAWLIGQTIGIGVAGSGFFNDYHYDQSLDEEVNLAGGYGGMLIEPILFPRSPVHIAFPVVAGVGGIAYTHSNWENNMWEYRDSWVEDSDAFLIFEPGVELEFNLLKFFRLALGATYRFTSNIDLIDTPPDVLNGVTAGITFKFGKF